MDNNHLEELEKALTLDDIARMMQNGFTSTASKDDIAALEARIDKIESNMALRSEMDRRFDKLNHKIDNELTPLRKEHILKLEGDITDHELRIKTLENRATPLTDKDFSF